MRLALSASLRALLITGNRVNKFVNRHHRAGLARYNIIVAVSMSVSGSVFN